MRDRLMEGLLRRAVVALRRRGSFDASDEAENFIEQLLVGRVVEYRGRPEAVAEWWTEANRALRIDAAGHRARIRFQPERAWNLALGQDTVVISDATTGVTWELTLATDSDPEKSKAVIVESRPSESKAALENATFRLEAALLIASLRQGYGFALRDRLPPSVITEFGLKEVLPEGVTGYKDNLGLTIFETPPPTLFIHLSDIKMSVSVDPTPFVELVKQALEGALPVEDRTHTAYELFASSRFENSSRSRFLLLVMAVEAMTTRVTRPEAEVAFLNDVLSRLDDAPFAADAKQTMASGLSELKKMSIGGGAARQISTDVSPEAAAEFKKMYGLRSRLVHGGDLVGPSELNDAANKLEPTVKTMLLNKLLRLPV